MEGREDELQDVFGKAASELAEAEHELWEGPDSSSLSHSHKQKNVHTRKR